MKEIITLLLKVCMSIYNGHMTSPQANQCVKELYDCTFQAQNSTGTFTDEDAKDCVEKFQRDHNLGGEWDGK